MESETTQKSPHATKRHGRNVSYNRIDLPRRNTRDPLQREDDPLASSAKSLEAPKQEPPPVVDTPTVVAEPPRDLSFLLKSENFNPIPTQDLPPPFRKPAPDPSTPISTLLSQGLFRAAAHNAALRLTSETPPPTDEIFTLLYTRLACLTLIGQHSLAATESRCLQDLSSPFWLSGLGPTKSSILPWELRVLAIRLQAIGVGDLRRAVPGYYDLARVARGHIASATNDDDKGLWKARLFDVGIRVANILAEIGDFESAAHHLESMQLAEAAAEQKELLKGRIGLLYLRIGRLVEARRYIVGEDAAGSYAEVLRPLLSVAEGNYGSAAKQLGATAGDDVLTKGNLAVTLVYAGEIKKAREVLEGMIEEGEALPLLLFNLSTIFELCTEKSKTLKAGLVEEVAKMEGSDIGWERSMQDFKL